MKILLADDHQLIRDGLRTLLGNALGAAVSFCEATSYDEARATLSAERGDIALAIIDIRMSGAVDTLLLEGVARSFPRTPLIVLSGHLRPDAVRTLLMIDSVFALISKSSNPAIIAVAVQKALAGDKLGDANRWPEELVSLHHGNAADSAPSTLPPRLAEIHRLLREGRSNKAIANLLNLSEGTVKNYVSDVFKQLKVENRVQAARRASPDSE